MLTRKFNLGPVRNVVVGEQRSIETTIEGQALFYKIPAEIDIGNNAEPFVCAMLLPAMQKNMPIHINSDWQVSATFLENLSKVQDILLAWYPGLHKIDFDVSRVIEDFDSPTALTTRQFASFYSGGVDATYTLLKNLNRLTHLIYVRGIDMQLNDDSFWQQCVDRNERIATRYNKKLVKIETNVRFFIRKSTDPALGWYVTQGCGMASIAHIAGFSHTYWASSNPYKNLHPWGSHPLVDPFFSSNRVKIHHDGCESNRYQKIQYLAEQGDLLKEVRVCWQDKGLNCGKCSKCLHFRTTLTLLKYQHSQLPFITDFSELKDGAHINSWDDYVEWGLNLELAQKVNNPQAIKALKRLLRPYEWKDFILHVDELLFNGKVTGKRREHR